MNFSGRSLPVVQGLALIAWSLAVLGDLHHPGFLWRVVEVRPTDEKLL